MTNATVNSGAVVAGRRRGEVRVVGAARPVVSVRPALPAQAVRSATAIRSGRSVPEAQSVEPVPAANRPVSWPAHLLVLASLAMIPWLAYLAATLPATTSAAHWDAVWVGLDTAEAAGLLATGLLLRRHDPRGSLTAAATATLLAVDAWFDCGTAAPCAERLIALAMAGGLELPLAVGLGVLAWRSFPQTSARDR